MSLRAGVARYPYASEQLCLNGKPIELTMEWIHVYLQWLLQKLVLLEFLPRPAYPKGFRPLRQAGRGKNSCRTQVHS